MKMDERQDSLRNLWMRIQAEEKAGARLRKIIQDRKKKRKRCINTTPDSAKVLLLWMIICFAGNVYQIFEISSQYFMFGITTNLQLLVDDIVEVPSITLCVELSAIMKWGKLTRDQRLAILDLDFPGWEYNESHDDNQTIASIPSKLSDVLNVYLKMAVTSNIHGNLSIPSIFNSSYNYKEVVLGEMIYVDKFGNFQSDYVPLAHEGGRKSKKKMSVMLNQVLKVSEFLRDIFKCYSFQPRHRFRRVS